MYKGDRFLKESILDLRTYFKPTETFQYTNFYSCHPPGVRKDFMKGDALRLLSKNSSQTAFEENMSNFAARLKNRGYPTATVVKHLSEVKFSEREMSLTNKTEPHERKFYPLPHNTIRLCLTKGTTHREMALDTELTTAKKYLQEATPKQENPLKRHPCQI